MRHPYREVMQAKPSIGTGSGQFTAAQVKTTGVDDFLYHAIHINPDGTARLAGENQRVDGFFLNFDGINSWDENVMLLYVFQDRGVNARNGGATPIPAGSKIVGAERATRPSGKTRYGYVKAYAADIAGADTVTNATNAQIQAVINSAINARGRVFEPIGGAHAVNNTTYPPADVIIRWGFE